MHHYIKFFLVTISTLSMATHVVEAAATATGASEPPKEAAAGGAGASARPVVALPGFEELAVRAYFADPAKKPEVSTGWVYSSLVPERDPKAVLAALVERDTLKFLSAEAYPTDNFEAIFNQLYKLVPYVDALITAHLELTKPKTTKAGGTVTGATTKPVLPAAGELTAADKALLNRDPAKAARAEVDGEIGRLKAQLEAAGKLTAEKVAAEAAKTKAIEVVRDELRAQLASVTEAEVRLRAQIASLQAEVEDAKVAKAKAAEEVAAVAAQKAENDTVRASEAETRAQFATLQRRVDALTRELEASTATNEELTRKHGEVYGQLTTANVALGKLRAQLAKAGITPEG